MIITYRCWFFRPYPPARTLEQIIEWCQSATQEEISNNTVYCLCSGGVAPEDQWLEIFFEFDDEGPSDVESTLSDTWEIVQRVMRHHNLNLKMGERIVKTGMDVE